MAIAFIVQFFETLRGKLQLHCHTHNLSDDFCLVSKTAIPTREQYTESIKSTIYEHSEFVAFTDSMNALFADWRQRTVKMLKGLTVGCHPKQVIKDLSENLLAHYCDNGSDKIRRQSRRKF